MTSLQSGAAGVSLGYQLVRMTFHMSCRQMASHQCGGADVSLGYQLVRMSRHIRCSQIASPQSAGPGASSGYQLGKISYHSDCRQNVFFLNEICCVFLADLVWDKFCHILCTCTPWWFVVWG